MDVVDIRYFSKCMLVAFLSLTSAIGLSGQAGNDAISITFHRLPLQQGANYHISELMYYISNIELKNQNTTVLSTNDVFLIDQTDSNSVTIRLASPNAPTFDHINFKIGIDSIRQQNGIGEGALDPIHGMYWTWQSGYINVKLEGTAPQSTMRNHEFTYHLGGFLDGLRCDKTVNLPLKSTNDIHICLDVSKALERCLASSVYHLMSPSIRAAELMTYFVDSFNICP